ncbi:aminoacyl--tRNA ligase-related protein [Streptococcus dentapri]|uniref:Proline--tRNA ligase n=1 Tax=Streptococcus dentapri TaxID=573564 RepID=A0ABV8D221_9STRE
MFHFTGRNGEYCLAPTGEEIVLDFVNNNIESYRDLPFNIFQIGMKYRDELRVRGGLLRSKEFLMKDGYSFHSNQRSLEDEYEKMKKAYLEIFSKLGLEVKTVKAISAEMGGKVSEEFMLPSLIGEDKMLFDEKTGLALNIELLEDKELLEQYLEEYKEIDVNDFAVIQCIELGHIFQLGTRYSEKMNGYFTDSDGDRKPYLMGCYGIGLGAICEQTCDEEGLKWPMVVSPYECDIIPVKGFDSQAEEVYEKLSAKGHDVLFDDRDIGFGAKIKDGKLLGIPYLVIIGKNFEKNGSVELESRETGEKVLIKLDELIEESVNWKKI